MSSNEEVVERKDWLSRRLLSTFGLSDEILFKLKLKGFTIKTEIEGLSDLNLKSICGLTDEEINSINQLVRNSHKVTIHLKSALDGLKAINPRIGTSCKSLDITLNGGLEVSRITQMCGEGGSGKTQFCMQLCINVQIPQQFGGLSGHSLYIDTENNLRPERLTSMANYYLNKYPELRATTSVECMKSRIHVKTCNTNAKDLVELVTNRIEPFIDKNPEIKLIVIDSIAQLFRYDHRGDKDKDVDKDYQLAVIGHKLRVIAHTKKVAVFITNQVSYSEKEGKDVPSLGKLWQTNCFINLMIKRQYTTNGCRYGTVLKSSDRCSSQRFYFNITETGIEGLLKGI